MISLTQRFHFSQNLIALAALSITMSLPLGARAGIASGPRLTNAAAAAENLHAEFYEAEQSLQERLKVGRTRYDQKQVARAKIIATMGAELRARQQTVIIQPTPAAQVDNDGPNILFDPSLMVGLISAALFALGVHLFRRKPEFSTRIATGRTAFARYTVE